MPELLNTIIIVLEKARKMKLISNNPSDDCCLQKPKQYIPQIYSAKELNDFMKKIIGNEIEIPVIIASYYGFRREEVIGLKWNRIDFDNNTITIAHVVTATTINHKKVIDKKDIPKNSTSYRTLPLINAVKEYLQKVKEKQEKNKNLFKNSYKNNEGYVCVNEEGNLINPDTLTKKFAKFLKDNELRKIRFHDLRHSIGSLLISKASTRQVQE